MQILIQFTHPYELGRHTLGCLGHIPHLLSHWYLRSITPLYVQSQCNRLHGPFCSTATFFYQVIMRSFLYDSFWPKRIFLRSSWRHPSELPSQHSSPSAIKLIELHSHRYSLQDMSSISDRWLICFVCSTLLMCTKSLFLRSSWTEHCLCVWFLDCYSFYVWT